MPSYSRCIGWVSLGPGLGLDLRCYLYKRKNGSWSSPSFSYHIKFDRRVMLRHDD